MKKIASVAGWMAALMVACCPCTAEMSVQDGHAYGQREIDGKRIVYDFDVPEEVESVKQYRTEAVRMKLGWVEQILKPYVQKPRSGDAWDLINDRQWNDTNFCYFEQNGRYACEGDSYIGQGYSSGERCGLGAAEGNESIGFRVSVLYGDLAMQIHRDGD